MIISSPKELFTLKEYSNSIIFLQRLQLDHKVNSSKFGIFALKRIPGEFSV